MSVTSQESSSQEIESDSKQSTNTTTLNNDSSSSSPLSPCQTLTPTDLTDTTIRLSTLSSATTQQITELKAFSSEISPIQTPSLNNTHQSPLVEHVPSSLKHDTKDTCLEQDEGNIRAVVEDKEKQSTQNFSQVSKDFPTDRETSNSILIVKNQTESDTLHLHSSLCTSTNHNSVEKEEKLSLKNCPNSHCVTETYSSIDGTSELAFEAKSVKSITNLDTFTTEQSLNSHSLNLAGSEATDTAVQCNGITISSVSGESNGQIEDTTKNLKQKKSLKQSNVKNKKNSKGKSDKQKKIKSIIGNSSVDIDQKKVNKKKDNKKNVQDNSGITSSCRAVKLSQPFPENAIPSEITTESAKTVDTEIFAQKLGPGNEYEEDISDRCEPSLNGLDEIDISNTDPKHNEVIMDGNEKNKNQLQFSDVPIQAGTTSYSSSSNNGAKKLDLFPEFGTSSEEPPMRPVRREKQKLPPPIFQTSNKNPNDLSTKPAAIDKIFEFPPISLRPDTPKVEPKVSHEESLAKQLKGTKDILESITVALTSDKTVTKTESDKENLLEREISLDVKKDSQAGMLTDTVEKSVEDQSESNTLKCGQEVLKTDPSTSTEEESGDSVRNNEKILKDGDTKERLHCEEIQENFPYPIPPPRSKKLYVSQQKYIQHKQTSGWDIEGGNVTDESSGDSTSSTTHESEESVIELLSSTHTSPDDRAKQDLSDEEEDIIFRGKNLQEKSEMMDIKSIPPDKTDVCTPSVSGPSQDSSQIMQQDKATNRDIMSLDLKSHSKEIEVSIQLLYADGLSKIIISEAIRESSKKRTYLPITEAVTRWLRSQSPEILSLPQPEDEPESDISSEDQETVERPAEKNKTEEESTGQKNVFCNPLPVPLHEDCNQLLVNIGVNQSDYNNGTGRRVAFNDIQYLESENENAVLIQNDNNRIGNSLLANGHNMLMNENKFASCKLSHTSNCIINTSYTKKSNLHEDCDNEQIMQDFRGKIANLYLNESICDKSCNDNRFKAKFNYYKTGEIRKEGNVSPLNAKMSKKSDCDESSASGTQATNSVSLVKTCMKEQKSSEKRPENKNNSKIDEKLKLNYSTVDDEFSFSKEETPECEWDLWDCNLVKPSSVLSVPKSPSPAEAVLTKTPDYYFSHMCDPTVSVAKYYSLGALQIEKVKTGKIDEDEILSYLADSSDEEVDALKHFQHELEDDDGLKTYTSPSFSSLILNSSNVPCNNSNKEDKRRESTFGNPQIYQNHYGEASLTNSSIILLENHSSRNVYNTTLSQRAQAAQLFHRKSSIIVSKLKGDGPFPCGGICCILQ